MFRLSFNKYPELEELRKKNVKINGTTLFNYLTKQIVVIEQ
jgi:hypothetical protein